MKKLNIICTRVITGLVCGLQRCAGCYARLLATNAPTLCLLHSALTINVLVMYLMCLPDITKFELYMSCRALLCG